jgi:hypothetical protein
MWHVPHGSMSFKICKMQAVLNGTSSTPHGMCFGLGRPSWAAPSYGWRHLRSSVEHQVDLGRIPGNISARLG